MQFFEAERIAYHAAAIVSVGMILYCAFQVLAKDPSPSALVGLFGSGGADLARYGAAADDVDAEQCG